MKTRGKHIVVGTLILTGVLAIVVDVFCAGSSSIWLNAVFGPRWMGRVRRGLIEWGMSTDFVCGYIAFILPKIPLWCVLFVVAFCLGLSSRHLAKVASLCFILWLPVVDFAGDVWFHYAYAPDWFPEDVVRHHLFGFNTQIVPALITVIVGLSAWSAGRLLGRLIARARSKDDRPPGATAGLSSSVFCREICFALLDKPAVAPISKHVLTRSLLRRSMEYRRDEEIPVVASCAAKGSYFGMSHFARLLETIARSERWVEEGPAGRYDPWAHCPPIPQ